MSILYEELGDLAMKEARLWKNFRNFSEEEKIEIDEEMLFLRQKILDDVLRSE